MRFINSPSRVAALLSGVFTFMFGLWIALPWEAFDGRPTFVLMGQILPELAWGSIFMAAGILKAFGAIGNNYRSARLGAWALTITWAVAALSFWISDWTSPIVWIGTYATIQAGHHHATLNRRDYEE